jgi:hypothetical protein
MIVLSAHVWAPSGHILHDKVVKSRYEPESQREHLLRELTIWQVRHL